MRHPGVTLTFWQYEAGIYQPHSQGAFIEARETDRVKLIILFAA